MTSIQRDPKNFDLVYDNYVALLADADRLRSALESAKRDMDEGNFTYAHETINSAIG